LGHGAVVSMSWSCSGSTSHPSDIARFKVLISMRRGYSTWERLLLGMFSFLSLAAFIIIACIVHTLAETGKAHDEDCGVALRSFAIIHTVVLLADSTGLK